MSWLSEILQGYGVAQQSYALSTSFALFSGYLLRLTWRAKNTGEDQLAATVAACGIVGTLVTITIAVHLSTSFDTLYLPGLLVVPPITALIILIFAFHKSGWMLTTLSAAQLCAAMSVTILTLISDRSYESPYNAVANDLKSFYVLLLVITLLALLINVARARRLKRRKHE